MKTMSAILAVAVMVGSSAFAKEVIVSDSGRGGRQETVKYSGEELFKMALGKLDAAKASCEGVVIKGDLVELPEQAGRSNQEYNDDVKATLDKAESCINKLQAFSAATILETGALAVSIDAQQVNESAKRNYIRTKNGIHAAYQWLKNNAQPRGCSEAERTRGACH